MIGIKCNLSVTFLANVCFQFWRMAAPASRLPKFAERLPPSPAALRTADVPCRSCRAASADATDQRCVLQQLRNCPAASYRKGADPPPGVPTAPAGSTFVTDATGGTGLAFGGWMSGLPFWAANGPVLTL